MSLYYQDNDTKLYNGDCRNMAALEDGSVQMVVTSPPYWGLRKYAGVPDLIWGGDGECEHEWGAEIPSGGHKAGETNPGKEYYTKDTDSWPTSKGAYCSLCGAWRGSYGLEPSPELYVSHTIEVLREVRRVLRDDGVVFWNLGDSYAGGHVAYSGDRWQHGAGPNVNMHTLKGDGLKPKDLVLIPFRVALAAQADGWWVRSVIIWDKANPMPESVRDRPTTSHEYIIMLTKSSRYYWDAEAVREPHTGPVFSGKRGQSAEGYTGRTDGLSRPPMTMTRREYNPAGRNVRSVWSFPSQPYPEAHFATFPEALPERCILAATPEVGCCEKCGAPWERIVEVSGGTVGRSWHDHDADLEQGQRAENAAKGGHGYKRESKGWQPTCKCEYHDPEFPIIDGLIPPKVPYRKVPSTVLDPFAGSGTTLWVAKRLGRKSVGYELSEEYCELAIKRLPQQAMELGG